MAKQSSTGTRLAAGAGLVLTLAAAPAMAQTPSTAEPRFGTFTFTY